MVSNCNNFDKLTNISQGSVEKHLGCGRMTLIFSLYCRFPAKFASESIVKIGHGLRRNLPKRFFPESPNFNRFYCGVLTFSVHYNWPMPVCLFQRSHFHEYQIFCNLAVKIFDIPFTSSLVKSSDRRMPSHREARKLLRAVRQYFSRWTECACRACSLSR